MRRALSAREIAELDDRSGLVGPYAPYVESVIVIDEDDADERTRRYELRVKGVTGTFCAEYFGVDVIETAPDSCLIEWSVRLPNGHERSLEVERYSGGLLDLETLQHAFRSAAATALGWGVTFQSIMPAEGMTDAVTDITGMIRDLKLQLQAIKQHAGDLPTQARAAFDDASRTADSLVVRAGALEELVAQLKPVKHPRG